MPATVAEAPRASKNGAVVDAAPEPPKRRMPVSDETVDVSFTWRDVPFAAVCRTEMTSGEADSLVGGDGAALKAALRRVVVSWDFPDADGKPLPMPADGGLEHCTYALLWELALAYVQRLAAPKG